MQKHRLCSIGRWMVVLVVVGAGGCAEGEWDWFGLNQPASKNKPVTKARRPVTSEPAVAETNQQPEPPADDPKSRDVDEKVDRYVRSMEPQNDPSYQNNDLSSKIQRQSDPDRAERVRQTAIRSRTEPEENESATEPAAMALAEPSGDESPITAQSDGASVNGDGPEANREDVSAPEQNPVTSTDEKAELTESSPPPLADKPTAHDETATAEPVIKPPVLSQVTVEPSSTPVHAEPLKDEPASPAANSQTDEVMQTAPAVSNEGAAPSPPAEKIPAGAGDRTDAPPVSPATVDSASPEPEEPSSALAADHNATEASSNEAARVDTPVEKSQDEVPVSNEVRTPPATENTANEVPIAPAEPASNSPTIVTPATVDTLRKKVQAQEAVVAKNPDNVEEQFKLRMLYLVDGQDEKALAASPSLNEETQEILLGQIRAMIAARSSMSRDPAVWANQQLEALETLRGLLRTKADVLVPRVELCRAIDGFGRFEPFDPLEFKAGAKNRVLLYIEVDNFQSEKTASGMYRTLLSVRESLMNKNGEELWSAKDDNIEDLARGKRRDFYLTIGPLAIPKSLAPGEYVFKVEVEDVLGGKINSNVVRFKMVP